MASFPFPPGKGDSFVKGMFKYFLNSSYVKVVEPIGGLFVS